MMIYKPYIFDEDFENLKNDDVDLKSLKESIIKNKEELEESSNFLIQKYIVSNIVQEEKEKDW